MSTFFVKTIGGSDLADGLTFANAWATLQKMADTIVAGDLGLVCADGVHVPAATVDLDTNAGTFNNKINWRGASATGVDDGTVATISGSGFTSGAIMKAGAANSSNHVEFEGLRFTAGNFFNFWIDTTQTGILFNRCRFDNASNDGFRLDSSSAQVTFIDCEIDNNGAEGVGASSASRGDVVFVNCLVHDNVGHGIDLGFIVTIQSCWIYKNGGSGINWSGGSGRLVITTSILDDNTGDGLTMAQVNDIAKTVNINNIYSNNGGWGITNDGNGIQGAIGSNHFFNNALGTVSLDGISEDTFADFDTIPGSTTGDPLYTSTTDGSEDYRTNSSSPVIAAGFPSSLMESSTLGGFANFPHIGSEVQECTTGGGGSCIIGGGGL